MESSRELEGGEILKKSPRSQKWNGQEGGVESTGKKSMVWTVEFKAKEKDFSILKPAVVMYVVSSENELGPSRRPK